MADTATFLPPDRLNAIGQAVANYGLILRGGFHAASQALATEADFPRAAEDQTVTVLLIGNAGSAMWEAVAPIADGAPHSLDRWTKRVIDGVATDAGAVPIYPFNKPAPPFQLWARRAEPVAPSPLGLLIHPAYGLWHAYRAALVLDGALPLPAQPTAASPCVSCTNKPCLSACPIGAFTVAGYDVPACADYISSPAGVACTDSGCRARHACPVGRDWRYPKEQVAFHMAAFGRAVAPLRRSG